MKQAQDSLRQPYVFPTKSQVARKELRATAQREVMAHNTQGQWGGDHGLTWPEPRCRGQEDAQAGSAEVGVGPQGSQSGPALQPGQASPCASIAPSEKWVGLALFLA